jgi:hypothetical protein
MRLWGFVKKMLRKYRENIEGIETRNEIRSFSENNLIQGSCHSVRPVNSSAPGCKVRTTQHFVPWEFGTNSVDTEGEKEWLSGS